MGDHAEMLPFDLDDLLPSRNALQHEHGLQHGYEHELAHTHTQEHAQDRENAATSTSPDFMQQALDFDTPGDEPDLLILAPDGSDPAGQPRMDDRENREGSQSRTADDAQRTLFESPEPEHHYIVGGVEVHDVELITDEDPAEQLALDIPVLPPINASSDTAGKSFMADAAASIKMQKERHQSATKDDASQSRGIEIDPLFE